MRHLLLPLSSLLAVGACTPSDKDSNDAPPLSLDDSAEDCTGNAPVVTDVVLSNGGERSFEGTTRYSFLIQTTATDDDHDLDRMAVDLWWDTTVDGEVDTERTPDVNGEAIVIRDLPCGVATGTSGLYIPMQTSGALQFDTEYEVAAIASDAHGVPSAAPGIGTGWTPKQDGTDGGP